MGSVTGLRGADAPSLDVSRAGETAEPNAALTLTARPGLVARWSNLRWLIALRSFAVFLLLWYGLSVWNANPIQLPSPLRVLDALTALAADGELFEHALVSVTRLVVSLAVAVALAVPLGFAMGLSREANAFIDPLVELLRPISGIAWIPLGLFIFGDPRYLAHLHHGVCGVLSAASEYD